MRADFDAESGRDPVGGSEQIGQHRHLRRAALVMRLVEPQGGAAGDQSASMNFRHLMHEIDGFADPRQIFPLLKEAKESAQVAERG